MNQHRVWKQTWLESFTAPKPVRLGTGVEHVAIVELCSTIGREEGVKNADGGKHAAHVGLEEFMKHRGFFYVNNMRAADLSYTKSCGQDGESEPHIRICKGESVQAALEEAESDGDLWKGGSLDLVETQERIATNDLQEDQIATLLEGYGIRVPVEPKQGL